MPISHTSPSGAPGDGSSVVLERVRRPSVPTTARCFPAAPRRLRRWRERFEELNESRLRGRVAHVAQQHVVHALKVRRLAGPTPVAPHDLAGERVLAEDLVAQHFDVMAGARVDVDHDAPMGRQQIAHRDQALAQAPEVARAGRTSDRRTPATARAAPCPSVALPRDLVVHAPGEKRRVEVRQHHLTAELGSERTQRGAVLSLDEPHVVRAARHRLQASGGARSGDLPSLPSSSGWRGQLIFARRLRSLHGKRSCPASQIDGQLSREAVRAVLSATRVRQPSSCRGDGGAVDGLGRLHPQSRRPHP